MAKKGRIHVESGGSATDIMTALIGCLILILLGILVIVLVSQALIIITDPDHSQIVSVVDSKVDGFRETKAFPNGNTEKEPVYVDVHRDRVEIHRYPYDPQVIRQRELMVPGNPFDKILDQVAEDAANRYVVFLIRPNASQLGRQLREGVSKKGGIDIGVELFRSDQIVDHVSASAILREEEKKNRLEKMKGEGGGSPASNPPSATSSEPPPSAPITPAD